MTAMIGRNVNKYDSVNAPEPILLNSSTYTNVLLANPTRIGYKIGNLEAHDILVKEQDAATPDQLDRGFPVFKRSVYESPVDNVAVGIISVKALTGSPTIQVVEY